MMKNATRTGGVFCILYTEGGYGKFQERQGSEGDFAVSGWEIL